MGTNRFRGRGSCCAISPDAGLLSADESDLRIQLCHERFLDSLTQSRHLTSLGIHNPLLIGIIKLTVRVISALISALGAFTPLGGENLAQLNPYLGIIIFVLAILASLQS